MLALGEIYLGHKGGNVYILTIVHDETREADNIWIAGNMPIDMAVLMLFRAVAQTKQQQPCLDKAAEE